MTRPPSPLQAVWLFADLGLRRARRGKLIWLSLIILALPVIAALARLIAGETGVSTYQSELEVLLRYLTPFLMALHASATVAEEVQQRTITYLFSRPIPRWTLPLGKYLANLLANAIPLLVAVVLIYAFSMLGEGRELWGQLPLLARSLAVLLLAAIYYGALAAAMGAIATSFAFAATLIYLLVVEVAAALIPGWLKVVAMSVHLRVLAGLYRPEESLFLSDPSLPATVSFSAILAMTALWLIISVAWVASSEYRPER